MPDPPLPRPKESSSRTRGSEIREINPGPQWDGKWRHICSSEWKEQPPYGGADKNRLTFTCQPQAGWAEGTMTSLCPEGCRDALECQVLVTSLLRLQRQCEAGSSVAV